VSKPIRHNTHILENKSNKYFGYCLPDEWYADKPDHDYGIDYNVKIVINNEVTGLNFSVQLKSTDNEKDGNLIPIRIKHSTLELYNTILEPVMLIVYVKQENEAYWHWFNDIKIDLTKSQETVVINIPKSNKLSSIDWVTVTKYVQNIFSIKTLVDGIKLLEYEEISKSEILAWKYYFSGNYEQAIFYLKESLKKDPTNIALLEGLAHSQYVSFDYKNALYNINKAIEISTKSNLQLTKACILAEDGMQNGIKGKIIEAKNIFREFINTNPSQDIYHYNYANTLYRLGDLQLAIDHFIKATAINPNNASAWKNLGQVYFDLHLHEKEIECYDKALAINPNLQQALFSKGVTLSRVYHQHENGLKLMLKAIEDEEEMLKGFSYGYWSIAYAFEKLNNLEDTLKWINKGLDYFPEDSFYLNFKSDFLAKNWSNSNDLKQEAIDFFNYRLELENDSASLYYLIVIQEINDSFTILELIKKHTTLLENIDLSLLEKCKISIKDNLSILLHYDKYLELREFHPVNRYVDHLISELFVISIEFWEIIEFLFAIGYNNAIKSYYAHNNTKLLLQEIRNGLDFALNSISVLIPDSEYTQDEAISIMAHIYIGFPIVIMRELGVQGGFISGKLGLDVPIPEDQASNDWYDSIRDKTLFITNKKLKLLKEE
jgi:tetratricopeptide (TPR) repeat protein